MRKISPSNLEKKQRFPFHHPQIDDVIFIHIMKTGGTSIRRSLEFNKVNTDLGFRKHYTAREIISLVGEEKWETAYKFSVVRNPWSRLVSLYNFLKRMRKIEKFKDPEGYPFDLWLLHLLRANARRSNLRYRLTQVEWLKDNNGEINIDLIGKYESLESDFSRVRRYLNLDSRLKHMEKGSYQSPYQDWYTKTTKELVGDYFIDDINAFDYSF